MANTIVVVLFEHNWRNVSYPLVIVIQNVKCKLKIDWNNTEYEDSPQSHPRHQNIQLLYQINHWMHLLLAKVLVKYANDNSEWFEKLRKQTLKAQCYALSLIGFIETSIYKHIRATQIKFIISYNQGDWKCVRRGVLSIITWGNARELLWTCVIGLGIILEMKNRRMHEKQGTTYF